MQGPAKDGSGRTGYKKHSQDFRGGPDRPRTKREQLTPNVPYDDPYLKIFDARIETIMKEAGILRAPARYRACLGF